MSAVSWIREHPAATLIAALSAAAVGAWYWDRVEQARKAAKLLLGAYTPADRPTFPTVPHGVILCPKDMNQMPADTSTLTKGDFIIIQLASKDKTFIEPTWARVLSIAPDRDRIFVQIVGEFTETGVRPIDSKKHRFHLGDKAIIGTDCVFDVLRDPGRLEGQILCGPLLRSVTHEGTDVPIYKPVDTRTVDETHTVRVVVASKAGQGTAWHEPLWVHITSISPTNQIIRGIVAQTPELSNLHGLRRFSSLQFTRDCVVGVSNPFLGGKD